MYTVSDLQNALKALSGRQIFELKERSGVPVATIYKIRDGQTDDPRLSTSNKLAVHLGLAVAPVADLAAAEEVKS